MLVWNEFIDFIQKLVYFTRTCSTESTVESSIFQVSYRLTNVSLAENLNPKSMNGGPLDVEAFNIVTTIRIKIQHV